MLVWTIPSEHYSIKLYSCMQHDLGSVSCTTH